MRLPWRRAALGLAVAFFAVPAIGVPAAAGEDVELVGRLAAPEVEGSSDVPSLLLHPRARRGFLIYNLNDRFAIHEFDLDSLKPKRRVTLPLRALTRQIIVDEHRDRFLVPLVKTESATIVFDGYATVDTTTLKQVDRWTVPPPTDILRSIQVQVPTLLPLLSGVGHFQPEGRFGPQKLLLLLEDDVGVKSAAIAGRNLVWLTQWDALSGEQDWVYQVNACESSVELFKQTIIRSEGREDRDHDGEPDPAIYLACNTRQGTGAAVRLELDDDGKPTGVETSFPGPLQTETVISDPRSDRLLFGVFDNGRKSYIVFDGPQTAYVGIVDVTRTSGEVTGIDRETGRVYAITRDNGLILFDARRTPAQQALVYKKFATGDAGVDRIVVDPARGPRPRRLFARVEGKPYYYVFEDNVPVSFDSPLSDLDRFTVDRAEEPGLTGRSFEATGHAYAVRTLIVGGAEGIPPPGHPLASARRAIRRLGSACTRFDREIVTALVSEVTLGESSSKAAAIAADADAGTKVDAGDPVGRCWAVPDPLGNSRLDPHVPRAPQMPADADGDPQERPGTPWPFNKAECSGGGKVDNTGANDHPAYAGLVKETGMEDGTALGPRLTGFRAEAFCAPTADAARGFARSAFHYPGATTEAGVSIPEVSVGDSFARVTEQLLPNGGVVTTAEAEARSVQIMGIGSIDLVRTRAVSRAAGRKGTADTTFERVVCGVITGSFSQPGCADPVIAVQNLDRALGTRGRARLPKPDRELALGTPGGYLASVQRDRMEEVSGRALNNDFATQVPGLEIIFFNDTLPSDEENGRARQVFQFAGVDASTTYGIYLLGEPFEIPDDVLDTEGALEESIVTVTRGGGGGGAGGSIPAGTRTVTERIRNGFTLLARSPGQAFPAIAIWLSLGMPVVMGVRRLALMRAIGRT